MRWLRVSSVKTSLLALLTLMLLAPCSVAQTGPAHGLKLQMDTARSGAEISLGGNFHSVEGSFGVKRGMVEFDAATGTARGEIVIDAPSGRTGNDGRDAKMHRSVLESERFPEIIFRPDHADGALMPMGDSRLEVHGVLVIHGSEHELTVPVEVHREGAAWKAKASFQVPYAKWGMKNPSVLLLRVAGFVDVQFHAAGQVIP